MRELVLREEHALAKSYCVQWGLHPRLVEASAAVLAAGAAARAATHLPLRLPPARLLLADTEASLPRCTLSQTASAP